MKTTPKEFLAKIHRLKVYRKGNQRAPHKPLYLLYCIASIQHGLPRLQLFADIEPKLKEALFRFGLSAKSQNPHYPFWRLKNDGLAEVSPSGPYSLRASSDDPKKSSLIEMKAKGGLLHSDHSMLKSNLEFQTQCLHEILDAHFPSSIHDELIRFFDLRLFGARALDVNTEAQFSNRVILAYGNRCAVTGFAIGYRGIFPGLEAAHICWPQSGGNDEIRNGVAMTTLYRKLFHLGLFTIDMETLKIRLSRQVVDIGAKKEGMSRLDGQKLLLPQDQRDWPDTDALAWHSKWVFRH